MTRQEAEKLIERYTEGGATPEEKRLVEYYFNKHLADSKALPNVKQLQSDNKEIWKGLTIHIAKAKPVRYKLWHRMAGVAAAVVVIGIGIYFFSVQYMNGRHPEFISGSLNYAKDMKPGKNTAILTLDNGKTINLSDAKTGIVIDASSLTYNDGSNVESGSGSESQTGKFTMITTSTPRGGTYQITLPDGTRVWLNAASSIKSPSTFAGLKNREVEVDGEAYFEVFHDAAKPFRVKSKGQVIEVLGTKFNINAYEDESVTRTTLLEGAVKVSSLYEAFKNAEIRIKPGQQTTLQNNKLTASDADMEVAFAWKNGYFVLNNESLESIMRKLSRWYNIEVEYKGDIPKRQFGGEISRNTNLSEVLKVLELSKVHFIIEGKKLIVTP